MIKLFLQIILSFMILATIKIIKDNKMKVKIESYILSIVIYTIIIMLLF